MTSFAPFWLLLAAAAAVVAAVALPPLARLVPLRLQQGWREEFAEMGFELASPLVPGAFELPKYSAPAMAVCGSVLGGVAAWAYGPTPAAAAICAYLLIVLLLVAINLQHQLLPDKIVIPLIWAGLLYGVSAGRSDHHVYGAAVGFVAPFVLLHVLRASTGKELFGHGDIKTLSAAGAWFGLGALPFIFGAFVFGVLLVGIAAGIRGSRGVLSSGPAHLMAALAYVIAPRLF